MGVIAKGIPRGCQGLFTPVSLGYPLSVFIKNSTLKQKYDPAVVIPLNPEGMGIEEWVILFSENFEGLGMGMGTGMDNSKKLCA